MSADNGIYILKLKDQYRVAHLSAIDNVYYCEMASVEDNEYACRNHKLIPTRVVEMWGDCKYTRNFKKALEIANKWCSSLFVCEYGVNVITCNQTWEELLIDATAFAKCELANIIINNHTDLYCMDKLQKIADGVYLSEWLNRKQYYKDLRKHDCGYWSVCYDKGCKCSIGKNVSGFDNEVYLRLKNECRC